MLYLLLRSVDFVYSLSVESTFILRLSFTFISNGSTKRGRMLKEAVPKLTNTHPPATNSSVPIFDEKTAPNCMKLLIKIIAFFKIQIHDLALKYINDNCIFAMYKINEFKFVIFGSFNNHMPQFRIEKVRVKSKKTNGCR